MFCSPPKCLHIKFREAANLPAMQYAVAHFIAMVRNGMNPPPGFISSMEKARMKRIERERRKREADNLESIRGEDISQEIKKFVKEFCRGGEK